MPAEFDMCVKNGGKVSTKSMPGGRYMHICFLGGKSYAGEVKMSMQKAKKDTSLTKSKPSYKILHKK